MATRILYLFPDTNLFIQCRPLHELRWKTWTEFDEVHVIVSRPVQSEIDQQRIEGNDRVGKRARAASSLLRENHRGDRREARARHGSDREGISAADLKPYGGFCSYRLDYGEPDDRLVGIAHAFLQQNPGVEARILTHDAGPLASAKMVGVPFEAVTSGFGHLKTTEAEKYLENSNARLRGSRRPSRISGSGAS